MSTEPPIHDVNEKLPDGRHAVRVFLPDGHKTHASWTGKVWWTQGGEIHPTHWQEMDFMRTRIEEEEEEKQPPGQPFS